MRPSFCSAHALYKLMKRDVISGSVVFKVTVEYTGEVNDVSIDKSTIRADRFLREISDFIMDSDFKAWARHDDDTVFLYPMRFHSI